MYVISDMSLDILLVIRRKIEYFRCKEARHSAKHFKIYDKYFLRFIMILDICTYIIQWGFY